MMDNVDERRYQLAMVDAFSGTVQGTRVPSMVNDATITASDYQSVQITIGSTGRAMAIINYNCVAASPYVVFNSLVSPFSSAAVKVDQQVDPSGNILQNYAELAYPFGQIGSVVSSNYQIGQGMTQLAWFSELRLVAAGFRLIKTSTSDTESG